MDGKRKPWYETVSQDDNVLSRMACDTPLVVLYVEKFMRYVCRRRTRPSVENVDNNDYAIGPRMPGRVKVGRYRVPLVTWAHTLSNFISSSTFQKFYSVKYVYRSRQHSTHAILINR